MSVGVWIHECVHSLQFVCLCGKFGEIHLFDSVAYSYHQIAVTIPPQGLLISNTAYLECIAYVMTFLITGIFAFILFKLFYSDYNAKKSEISSKPAPSAPRPMCSWKPSSNASAEINGRMRSLFACMIGIWPRRCLGGLCAGGWSGFFGACWQVMAAPLSESSL